MDIVAMLARRVQARRHFYAGYLGNKSASEPWYARRLLLAPTSKGRYPNAFMFIGYARVSTEEQTLALQLDALHSAGCIRVFEDKATGSSKDRRGLNQALDQVRDGDVLVVWLRSSRN